MKFSKKNICPIFEETRIWMENALIWLINQFGEQKVLNTRTLLPIEEDFPVEFDKSEKSAKDCLKIVASQMDTDPENIILIFFNEQLLEINGTTASTIFGQQYENEKYSSGIYEGKNSDDKFTIGIEVSQLKEPDKLIATLAHEIAHIKILGEGLLKENDEYLTDLVTVFFGMGIFNANTAFKFSSDIDRWSYSKQGYLSQQEWGYALALYAYIRREENPNWVRYLTPNIQSDFKKSQLYINNNIDKVLV